MSNNDLEFVVRMLQDTNLKAISKKVDLSYSTVYRIARGENDKPTFATVKKLADYFREKAKEAVEAEILAIRTEPSKYNVTHSPERRRGGRGYLTREPFTVYEEWSVADQRKYDNLAPSVISGIRHDDRTAKTVGRRYNLPADMIHYIRSCRRIDLSSKQEGA